MFTINRSIAAARRLAWTVAELQFSAPVTHVYNPLEYAWAPHRRYLEMMNPRGADFMFLGMNPGPWGMAQTGVPFGHVPTVRDWLRIDAKVKQPSVMHPKRPVEGLACTRSEVSGERLWGLFRDRFQTPQKFFQKHIVINYCPLVFMEESGRNRTPNKLRPAERSALQATCDIHLAEVLAAIQPRVAIGVGAYAEQCLQRVIGEREIRIARILHPSPASPLANKNWSATVTKQLEDADVW